MHKINLLIIVKILLALNVSLALPTLNDNTIGQYIVAQSRSTHFDLQSYLSLFEGSIKSTQNIANIKEYRMIAEQSVTKTYDFLGKIALGFEVQNHFSNHIWEDTAQDSTQKTSFVYRDYLGRFSMRVRTPTQVDLVAGLTGIYVPEYSKSFSSSIISTNQSFQSASAKAPFFGLFKSTANWKGGFFYQADKEEVQKYSTTAIDESEIIGTDYIYLPATLGLVTEIPLAGSLLEVEVFSVQSGNGGSKGQDGITVKEDHNRFKVGWVSQLAIGRLRTALYHKTLSYSNSSYIDLDTIPITSLRVELKIGDDFTFLTCGLIYTYGVDGQSLDEFNSDYELQSYGGVFKLGLAF